MSMRSENEKLPKISLQKVDRTPFKKIKDKRIKEKQKKHLEYWKNNAKEDYIKTPISVLRYITELEEAINKDEK